VEDSGFEGPHGTFVPDRTFPPPQPRLSDFRIGSSRANRRAASADRVSGRMHPPPLEHKFASRFRRFFAAICGKIATPRARIVASMHADAPFEYPIVSIIHSACNTYTTCSRTRIPRLTCTFHVAANCAGASPRSSGRVRSARSYVT